MNGILHCCSHNNASDLNATIDPEVHLDPNKDPPLPPPTPAQITEEEVFRNVCYYLDRIVTDIAQPKEVVYMAIDGVAPRAKMNQQRSRRYRSGKEQEIERTFEEAHKKSREEEREKRKEEWRAGMMRGEDMDLEEEEIVLRGADAAGGGVREIEQGRFVGKISTHEETTSSTSNLSKDNDDDENMYAFHSNSITPGTPFFDNCTSHLLHFIKHKLTHDPKWKHLTIIFSGPNVPGE
eukprot:5557209-Ditylum_brightwellii.AAC.1